MVGTDHTTVNHWPPELRSALMKYCSKYDLDKTYGVFSLVTKQLYNDRLISKEVYDFYIVKFSKPISSMPTAFNQPRPMTFDEMKNKQKLDEETRYFEAILHGEWAKHESLEWRQKVLAKAQKYKDLIPQAQSVLDLGAYLL